MLLAMRVVERGRDRRGDPERLVDRQAAGARDAIAQGFAAEVRHREPEEPVALARVVHREDVRMDQSRGDPDFLEESPGQLAPRAHGGMQHLEGHDPVMPQIAGLVDRRHAAGTDFLAELVIVGDGCPEAGEELRRERHTPNCLR